MELADAPAGWVGPGRVEEVFDGHGGRVWRVTRPDGSPAILKAISPRAMENAASGTAFLQWREGVGAIRLYGSEGCWQLLEDAGRRTLLDVVWTQGDTAASVIAADALAVLHQASPKPPPADLIPLRQHFTALLDRPETAHGGDADLFALAARTAKYLLDTARDERPLHGDFHHENLLHSPRGWLAIDPAGLFGDPGYDAANLFYNPLESEDRTAPARISGLADILSSKLAQPRDRLLGWALSHASLSAAWHLEDGDEEEAAKSLAVARAVAIVAGLRAL